MSLRIDKTSRASTRPAPRPGTPTQPPEQVRSAVLPAYGRLLDGLYTYCLSVLCEHEAALAALSEVRELAVRNGARLADPGLLRAWLYSLARYACVRRLAESGAATDQATTDRTPGALPPHPEAGEPARRRRELAALAWPEAAGTTAEQREALELSIRHRLTPLEVAAVLGLDGAAARRLLATGAAEVGRTRLTLLVLSVGNCPELARIGGSGAEHWRSWVLGPGLRRELVRHVVECPTCRGTAERVAAEVGKAESGADSGATADELGEAGEGGGLGPGLPGLALLPAPVPARRAAAEGLGASGDGPGSAGAGLGGPGGGLPARHRAKAAPAAGGAAFLAGAAAGRLVTAGRVSRTARADRAAQAARIAEAAAEAARVAAEAALAGEHGDPDGAALDGARQLHFDQRGFPRHRAPSLLERHRPGGDLHERAVLVRQRAVTTGVLAAVLSAPLAALWVAHRDGAVTEAAATVSTVRVDGAPGAPGALDSLHAIPLPAAGVGAVPGSGAAGGAGGSGTTAGHGFGGGHPGGLAAALIGAASTNGVDGAAGAETLLPRLQGVALTVPAAGAVPLDSPSLHPEPVPAPPPGRVAGARLTVEAGAYGSRTVLTLTNSGDSAIDWHAVPSCDWLRLSRDSGSLAPGQRITVTVTVDDQRAPQDHWTAQISLPPSEAVVTLEGGPDRRGGPSQPADPSPSPTSPSTPSSPSSTPGDTPSASARPSGSASSTPSETPSSGSSASSAPASSVSPSASPTSGPSGTASPSTPPSSSPSTAPSPSTHPSTHPSGTPSGPAPSPAPTSATSAPSASPIR